MVLNKVAVNTHIVISVLMLNKFHVIQCEHRDINVCLATGKIETPTISEKILQEILFLRKISKYFVHSDFKRYISCNRLLLLAIGFLPT